MVYWCFSWTYFSLPNNHIHSVNDRSDTSTYSEYCGICKLITSFILYYITGRQFLFLTLHLWLIKFVSQVLPLFVPKLSTSYMT